MAPAPLKHTTILPTNDPGAKADLQNALGNINGALLLILGQNLNPRDLLQIADGIADRGVIGGQCYRQVLAIPVPTVPSVAAMLSGLQGWVAGNPAYALDDQGVVKAALAAGNLDPIHIEEAFQLAGA
jgi:hypothetical protein